MEEAWYRASRLCRLLGNPVAFQVVLLLDRESPLAPREIAREVKRAVSTVSETLAKLRGAELVRYDARGGHPRYWLKQPRETRAVLAGLLRFVHSTRHVRGKR
jgi:DNA-binding transcriptional ArsR family regulator